MIDIWIKLLANQLEVSLNLTRAVYGLAGKDAPASVHAGPAVAMVPDKADAPAATPLDEPAQLTARQEAVTVPDLIMAFLESANRGATVRQIAEHLEMDKKSILPLLKTMVKEGRIDELLGRYCVLENHDV